jgi:hypothetical protein
MVLRTQFCRSSLMVEQPARAMSSLQEDPLFAGVP